MTNHASRTPRLNARHAAIIALAAALYSTSSFALGTDEQRAACTPDVFRLCGSEIPFVERIVACLKKEKPHLSPGCQAVFNAPPQQAATRSLATPEVEWCVFGPSAPDTEQQNWVKWCGAAARKQ
jgi:hypothetical protein